MTTTPRAIVFDVGHGSCVLLEDGPVRTIIDCKESAFLVEFLVSRKIDFISQVVISHADADHIAGVLGLIQSDYIKLGTVFVNADASKDSTLWYDLRLALQDAVSRKKLKVKTEIGDGMADQLTHHEVTIEVIAPGVAARLAGPGGRTPQGKSATSNAMSVVLRLHHQSHPVMLLPGDLDKVGLADLVARGKQITADVLLFPHHGGHIGHGGTPAARKKDNATFAKAVLAQVKPQLVLFSIGRGKFSTPRPEIIKEVTSQGAPCHIHCTQLSEHCHAKLADEPLTHLSDLPAFGRAANQSCGGSIEVKFAGNKTVSTLDRTTHHQFVSRAVKQPLCLTRQPVKAMSVATTLDV